MSAKKKYRCQAFIEDVYSISIYVDADNEDEALEMAREKAESMGQGESRSPDLMDFQESRVQDEILVEEKDMGEYDKNESTGLTSEWRDLGRFAHKVLHPWKGTWGEVHAILDAHRQVLESKNLECEEDDWLEAARLYPEGVYDAVPGGCSYSMHNVVRWYLVAKREGVRDQASVRYDIDRAVERVQQCIRGETGTKDSLTEFELREEAGNLCLLLSEYFEMEDET